MVIAQLVAVVAAETQLAQTVVVVVALVHIGLAEDLF
jgi:hypothetical protein